MIVKLSFQLVEIFSTNISHGLCIQFNESCLQFFTTFAGVGIRFEHSLLILLLTLFVRFLFSTTDLSEQPAFAMFQESCASKRLILLALCLDSEPKSLICSIR